MRPEEIEAGKYYWFEGRRTSVVAVNHLKKWVKYRYCPRPKNPRFDYDGGATIEYFAANAAFEVNGR